MENLFKNVRVDLFFDLKGSTQGRTRLKDNQKLEDFKDMKIALKDNDYIKHVKTLTFVETFSDQDKLGRRKLMEVIKTDCNFLSQCEIIDYSLLLGKIEGDREDLREAIRLDSNVGKYIYFTNQGQPYVIGIIDPLTSWRQVI